VNQVILSQYSAILKKIIVPNFSAIVSQCHNNLLLNS